VDNLIEKTSQVITNEDDKAEDKADVDVEVEKVEEVKK
jgi:hypothetical protein